MEKNIYKYSIVDSELKKLLIKITFDGTKVKNGNWSLLLDNLILIISTSQTKFEAIYRLNFLN